MSVPIFEFSSEFSSYVILLFEDFVYYKLSNFIKVCDCQGLLAHAQ